MKGSTEGNRAGPMHVIYIKVCDLINFYHIVTKCKSLCNFLVIEQEKGQKQLISGIENFDSSKLKHAETCEKNPLPTKEIIDQEKSA